VPALGQKFTGEQISESKGVSSIHARPKHVNIGFSLQIPTEKQRRKSILWEITVPLHCCDMRFSAGPIERLGADGVAEGVGYGLGEALNIGIVFGFDHDASEGLSAGITEDDTAVFA